MPDLLEAAGLVEEIEPVEKIANALERAFNKERPYRPGEVIVPPNLRRPSAGYLVKGIALEVIGEGAERQILAVRMRADLFGLHAIHLPSQPSALIAKSYCLVRIASPSSVRRLSKETMLYDLLQLHAASDWVAARVQLLRQRLPPHKALAHLICELSLRAGAIGGQEAERFPLTHTEIGEVTGNSLAQVTRAFAFLRQQNLIAPSSPIAITNWEGLTRLAGFDARYLHLLDQGTKPAFLLGGQPGPSPSQRPKPRPSQGDRSGPKPSGY